MAQNPLLRLASAEIMPSRFASRPYVHQTYPRVNYHEDGRTLTVASREEEDRLCPKAEGWQTKPFPPKPAAVVLPDPTMKELNAQVQELAGKLSDMQTWALEASAEIMALRELVEKQHKQKSGVKEVRS